MPLNINAKLFPWIIYWNSEPLKSIWIIGEQTVPGPVAGDPASLCRWGKAALMYENVSFLRNRYLLLNICQAYVAGSKCIYSNIAQHLWNHNQVFHAEASRAMSWFIIVYKVQSWVKILSKDLFFLLFFFSSLEGRLLQCARCHSKNVSFPVQQSVNYCRAEEKLLTVSITWRSQLTERLLWATQTEFRIKKMAYA